MLAERTGKGMRDDGKGVGRGDTQNDAAARSETSSLAGVKVVRMRIWIFAVQGLVCAIAGILLPSRITPGQTNAATRLEPSVISLSPVLHP
jgi:ABC-type xylose transport system permease subunit